jgi:uncharacterized protein with GYD domain
MATFFMFGKYSGAALPDISATRTQKAADIVKKHGGEIKSIHALLGPHDLVLIVDLPGVEQVMQASVGLAKLTGISFTTSPAVEVAEFDQLVEQLQKS